MSRALLLLLAATPALAQTTSHRQERLGTIDFHTSGAAAAQADFTTGVLPVEFGPPDFTKPPYELLGEWLLADGRPTDARQAFEAALAFMPRALALVAGAETGERGARGDCQVDLLEEWAAGGTCAPATLSFGGAGRAHQ